MAEHRPNSELVASGKSNSTIVQRVQSDVQNQSIVSSTSFIPTQTVDQGPSYTWNAVWLWVARLLAVLISYMYNNWLSLSLLVWLMHSFLPGD